MPLMRRLLGIFALCGTLFVLQPASPYAQHHATSARDSSAWYAARAKEHAKLMLNQFMDVHNDRNKDFSLQISRADQLKPLDGSHLDSLHLLGNIDSIKLFLQYLTTFREEGVLLQERIQDSIEILRIALPEKNRIIFLRGFAEAYTADVEAFGAYTQGLQNLYLQVLSVLTWIKKAPFEIKDGNVEFRSRDDYDKYNSQMKLIGAANKELAKSIDASRKATELLNKRIQEAHGKLK